MTTIAPKVQPLGRGLSALFGDTDSSYAPKAAQPAQPAPHAPATSATQPPQPPVAHPDSRGFRRMPITWLEPGRFQPRRHFDEDALKGLADSIRERGVLEPLLVRPLSDQRCEIVAGERRWRAAQMAGAHDVPVILRDMTDREALEFGLIENVQREDLSLLEEAIGYQRLLDDFNHSQEGLSKIIGKSRPHINQMLRILTLPEQVKAMIAAGDLSFGHARTLIGATDPLAMAQQIVKRGLNVRQAEALAKRAAEPQNAAAPKKPETENGDVLALEKELERVTGLKIKIHTKGAAGSLTVHYHDLDQLDDVIRRLRG